MNLNVELIRDYIIDNDLQNKEENLNSDGSTNWSFVEADLTLDYNEVEPVPFILDYDDIDAAFDLIVKGVK